MDCTLRYFGTNELGVEILIAVSVLGNLGVGHAELTLCHVGAHHHGRHALHTTCVNIDAQIKENSHRHPG
jgi:hypothetical protein